MLSHNASGSLPRRRKGFSRVMGFLYVLNQNVIKLSDHRPVPFLAGFGDLRVLYVGIGGSCSAADSGPTHPALLK